MKKIMTLLLLSNLSWAQDAILDKNLIIIGEHANLTILNRIELTEKKLRFSQSQPLEDELNLLKKEDTKLLCQLDDFLN